MATLRESNDVAAHRLGETTMGLELALFIQLFCVPPVLRVWSLDWTVTDIFTVERAKHHCYEHHYPANPCLKEFLKIERKGGIVNYRAICGGES